jgi:hypothetical protein
MATDTSTEFRLQTLATFIRLKQDLWATRITPASEPYAAKCPTLPNAAKSESLATKKEPSAPAQTATNSRLSDGTSAKSKPVPPVPPDPTLPNAAETEPSHINTESRSSVAHYKARIVGIKHEIC